MAGYRFVDRGASRPPTMAIPGFLALLGIPVRWLAPLISVQAMWAVAATESLLLAAGFVLDLTTLEIFTA